MKRKVLCSILAILIILARVPMTAFAADGEKTITNITTSSSKLNWIIARCNSNDSPNVTRLN